MSFSKVDPEVREPEVKELGYVMRNEDDTQPSKIIGIIEIRSLNPQHNDRKIFTNLHGIIVEHDIMVEGSPPIKEKIASLLGKIPEKEIYMSMNEKEDGEYLYELLRVFMPGTEELKRKFHDGENKYYFPPSPNFKKEEPSKFKSIMDLIRNEHKKIKDNTLYVTEKRMFFDTEFVLENGKPKPIIREDKKYYILDLEKNHTLPLSEDQIQKYFPLSEDPIQENLERKKGGSMKSSWSKRSKTKHRLTKSTKKKKSNKSKRSRK